MAKKKAAKAVAIEAPKKAPKPVTPPVEVAPRPVFKPEAEVVWSGTLYRWTTHGGAKTVMHVIPDMVNLVQANSTPASMPVDTKAERVELVIRD